MLNPLEEQCLVFISHASEDEGLALELSEEFDNYGVESVVSHKTIPPFTDWHIDLERYLSCCSALVYLSTEKANQSSWCQQEVGWALGRGIPVAPIVVDRDVPAAFLNRHQALFMRDESMAQVAQRIVAYFLQDKRMTNALIDSLVEKLGQSRTYDKSKAIAQCLVEAPGITRKHAQEIERIIAENNQVSNADWGKLPETLRGLKGGCGRKVGDSLPTPAAARAPLGTASGSSTPATA